MKNIEILLDASRGQYIPQDFATEIRWDKFANIASEDMEALKRGPEVEGYWDIWTEILDNAEYIEGGQIWRLFQDGDLFLVNYDALSDEEHEDFFGEPKES